MWDHGAFWISYAPRVILVYLFYYCCSVHSSVYFKMLSVAFWGIITFFA